MTDALGEEQNEESNCAPRNLSPEVAGAGDAPPVVAQKVVGHGGLILRAAADGFDQHLAVKAQP